MALYIGQDLIGKVVVASGGSSEINNQDKTVTPTESQQAVQADEGYTGLGTVTVNAIDDTYIGSAVTRKSSATYNTSASDQTISSGQYLTGTQTIKGVQVSGLNANSILSGVTVTVGDANDADRIASVTGAVTFQTYYTGSSAPSSSLGSDGDIYLKTS